MGDHFFRRYPSESHEVRVDRSDAHPRPHKPYPHFEDQLQSPGRHRDVVFPAAPESYLVKKKCSRRVTTGKPAYPVLIKQCRERCLSFLRHHP